MSEPVIHEAPGHDTATAGGQAPRLGVSGRLAGFFQNHALTPLIAIVLMLIGIFAVLVTPREEEPQIDVTMATVSIPFPGASARDVERLVATPAERVLSRIAGVEHVYSVSRPDGALVTIQYEVGVPRTEALVRLFDTLEAHSDWLPQGLGVGEPLVRPMGIDDVPIWSVTLWAEDARPADELARVARSVEQELKRVPGTRDVMLHGAPERAVRVLLDAGRMRSAGIPVERLAARLQGVNVSMPAGTLLRDGGAIQVQTGDFLRSAEDVSSLVVGAREGRPVYLRDVATVEAGPAPASRYVWHMPSEGSVHPAVTIAVTKKPGENAVDVARGLDARFAALVDAVVPSDVSHTVTRNYGETAAQKASQLMQKLAFATASVILLVGLALGVREAVIVGAAVILTLTATLFASWAWGFTLNRVSLFALIFSIGILVDDAIVVVENIHRHRALEPGAPLSKIIPIAVDEVGGPTILATLTVIAALLPMAFVSGLMGPYMSPIPINASMGMMLSLAIAFIVTPWLALKLMKSGGAAHHGKVATMLERGFGGLLARFVTRPGAAAGRLFLGLLVIVGLAGAVALVPLQAVILKMLPFDNKSEFQVVVDMPAGTSVETTNAVLVELAQKLAGAPEVTHVQGYAGTASPITFNGLVRQYNMRSLAEQGDLQVTLAGKEERKEQSHAIATRLLPELEKIAAPHRARIKLVEVPPGPPVMSPIVAEVYGPDDAGRAELARRIESAFREVPGIVAIDTSLEQPAPKLQLVVKRSRAATLGIADSSVALAARAALSGHDATWMRTPDAIDPVPVRLQLPETSRGALASVLAMPVAAADGRMVPLSELVDVVETGRDMPIMHKDLVPVTYVFGDMAAVAGNSIDSPLYGMFALRGKLAEAALPGTGELGEHFFAQPQDTLRGYSLKWDGEWQITWETFRDMGLAYGVGLILIYLLVVAQFRSYLTPLIIMAPIPLTIIGVMPGHALLGAQFTATSMIGMIALAGIIVRNSILLVDFIQLETARGVPFAEAVVRSAAVRAQPILLTALAAMLGAFFILDDPIFSGLAVSLIFGILVSTLLTLVVIPVLYYIVWRKPASRAA
ncbi:MAG: multidrug transporter AcrB [Lautropia sp. SCN 70-15]|nr:MAG: multidrug transporter AcrB [Lautropia sp. SCN 70-15]